MRAAFASRGGTIHSRAAFTLIELVVVIALVAILASLLLPVFGQARDRAEQTTALSQMHQIAVALASYPADHNGKLPGPMFPGQMPMLDPMRNGRLVLSLAPYLSITIPTTPRLIPLFIPPAYKRNVTANFLQTARTYVINAEVPLANGGVVNPWGDAATGVGVPMSLALVPSQVWAFTDADQRNPRVIGAPWQTNTPATMIHRPHRLGVRFDGSAGEIKDQELAVPPS